MVKHILLIAIVVSTFSCSNNATKNTLAKMSQIKDSIPITWIQVSDSLSNFEALELQIIYTILEHMSPRYLDGRWELMDTLVNNEWFYTRIRGAACKTLKDSILPKTMCVESQTHIINKSYNKVIQFSGTGSGYFAKIDFVYDETGKLIEYRDIHSDETYYLNYNVDQLVEVLKTEIIHGIKKEKERFLFKK